MKIKHILLAGFLQFFCILFFGMFKTSKMEYIDLTVLILSLNLVTFVIMANCFNSKMSFFIIFSGLSFLSVIIYMLISFSMIAVFKSLHLISNSSELLVYATFALKQFRGYNNMFGFLKTLITYIIFTMIPSFLVLSLNSKNTKKKFKRK